MGVVQLLDALPGGITRSPSRFWSVFARSLGEQGGAGRTALAWRWALTGDCPSPVTLTAAVGRPPDRAEILAEAHAVAELARPDADPGSQVMQARFVLEWITGSVDALPLWSTAAATEPAVSAPFARDRAGIEAAHWWALLARYRYSRGDGPASVGGRQAFSWALGALDLLGWACGETTAGPFTGLRAGGRPSLYQVSLDSCQVMTEVRLARQAGDLARAMRCEAAVEAFLWLAGWEAQPPADRHGHARFEDCPERTAECACDAAGQCLAGACDACRRVPCVHGFGADKLSSPLAGG
jgi:hypothetical protein